MYNGLLYLYLIASFLGAIILTPLLFRAIFQLHTLDRVGIYPAYKKDIPDTEGWYVYVLQDVTATFTCKIGMTNKPTRRLKEFEVGIPIDLVPIYIIPLPNEAEMRRMEKYFHEYFKDKRCTNSDNEFFNLTYRDIFDIPLIMYAYIEGKV